MKYEKLLYETLQGPAPAERELRKIIEGWIIGDKKDSVGDKKSTDSIDLILSVFDRYPSQTDSTAWRQLKERVNTIDAKRKSRRYQPTSQDMESIVELANHVEDRKDY